MDGSERRRQLDLWSRAAPGWRSRQASIVELTRPVTDQMVEMLALGDGDRVVDIACGAGNPALAIAEQVGPNGHVLGLDITAAMIDAAREQAHRAGIRNVAFRQIEDETRLGVPAGSFDAATCRFGLMFMPDPVAALQAAREALRPEGRVCVATWGAPERNPMPALRRQIFARYGVTPSAPPPSWDRVSSIEGLEGVLVEAGFEDVETVAVGVVINRAETATELWDQMTESSAEVIEMLARVEEGSRAELRATAIKSLEARFPGSPIEVPGEALVSAGQNGD